ncbi:MAG: hypothetical protein ACT4QD_16090 [Acidobacteriota bacterium]
MADFTIRSESVDVEQIMKQIRSRIAEKRGVDYTEEQVRELASVRLEKFLDPKNLRSDLLAEFRKSRPALPDPPKEPPPVEAPWSFELETIYETHRGALRFIRRLLNPVLKLFFNPNPVIQVLQKQAQLNVDILKRDLRRRVELQQHVAAFERSRAEWNILYYEVLHNLVLETTRNGIELKNLKMRVEALASRLDFSERRVRALEGVVQYRPEAVRQRDRGRDHDAAQNDGLDAGISYAQVAESQPAPGGAVPPGGSTDAPAGGSRRRRRRRRGRRGVGGPAGESADASAPVHDASRLNSPSEGGFGQASALGDEDGDEDEDEAPDGPESAGDPDQQ